MSCHDLQGSHLCSPGNPQAERGSVREHPPCIRKAMFPTRNAFFLPGAVKRGQGDSLRWRHPFTRTLHLGEINPPDPPHETWMELANVFRGLKGPKETLLHASSMTTGASFLWRWARAKLFPSPSRVQFYGGQVCTWTLQRCCATNTRTAAYSQYFSFSLCTPSARCTVTFWASRASRGMSARSHMMGK